MRLPQKVDRTLVQRQAVQQMVRRVRDESITPREMEEIGVRLGGEGLSALNALLRELGRAEDPEVISRCGYLLDFFDEDQWLSPLIAIALRRRELPEPGRGALLSVLEEYGVDVDGPPFSSVLPSGARQGEEEGSGELDDEALVSLLDDFLGYPTEVQLATVDLLSREREPWVVRFLEAILWHEEPGVVLRALQALGRVPLPAAAAALSDFAAACDPSLAAPALKALRRLSFRGVVAPEEKESLPFHDGYVSAPDAEGYRSLFISRWEGTDRIGALYLQVHERRGLLAAWGGGDLDVEAFEEEVQAFSEQEELYRVAPAYVMALVRDALYRSGDLSYLPADFYLGRKIFKGVDLSPAPFCPDLTEYAMRRPLTYLEGERLAGELIGDTFFGGWLFIQRRVYDLAQLYRDGKELDEVVEMLCEEMAAPQLPLIAGRLMATADLMRECGSAPARIVDVVALAQSLQSYPVPCHLHPFLRRVALESLQAAGDLLEGGKRRAAG